MGKSQVISSLLFALAATTIAQGLTLPSLERKGAIETMYVAPENPTTAAPVVLHVTTGDALKLDRIETQRIGNTFMIRVHWTEPAAGSPAFDPGHGQKSLGTLAKGTYRLFVQSSWNGRLAGSKQMSFAVVEAPSPEAGDVIDDVWVTPNNPTTSDSAAVHVSGAWPTTGYSLTVAMTRLTGRTARVDLYFEKPQGPVAMVVTPFNYVAPLRLAMAGTYAVHVRVYLDGQLVDWTEIAVEVAQGTGGNWGWDLFPWNLSLL